MTKETLARVERAEYEADRLLGRLAELTGVELEGFRRQLEDVFERVMMEERARCKADVLAAIGGMND